ncbi:recombinase family protein [Actinomyces timonensis]|uniref:recombinase family protein n=1 Tax=Actinomyces timonensis TaxID=1288391 RepID=UPI001FCB56FC|nr:recombinase family protein [Actinomyces timonensis]
MTKQTTTNAQEQHPAVHSAVPTAALDGQTAAGPIAIFYGAARYPFELARQRELVEDYADAMGLNLVTEFHDREGRQYGLKMLLDACQRGGVEYVITAGWPTPNLTTTEADKVVDQLAQAGTHLVCLNTWHPGDGTPPAWWNDEEGAWMRQLDAMREEERRQRQRDSQSSQPGETGGVDEVDQVGEPGQPSDVNQAGEVDGGTDARETSKAGDASVTSTTSQANEQHEEVHHA